MHLRSFLRFTVWLLICLLTVGPQLFAGNNNPEQELPLETVLNQITAKTGFRFIYEPSLVKKKAVSFNIAEADRDHINDCLKQLAGKTALMFTVDGNNIVVTPKPVQTQNPPAPGPAKITGRVVDFENGDPLASATVRIANTQYVTITDEKGYYTLDKIPAGKYDIMFSYIGYETGTLHGLQIGDGKTVIANFKLQTKRAMKEVVIKGLPRRRVSNTTDAQLINEVRTARSVVSGVSNEQIARSMDRDAAEVVRRVAGVNVTNDRFIVVRGLNRRYNVTFLNDNIAPATELDSKAFSYDLISSSMIDRILIYKSPSPDLPGDFAGGVVKIFTKRSQLTRQFDLQVSTQYRPGSTFSDMLTYAGGKYDVLGVDDGKRALPAGIPDVIKFNLGDPKDMAKYWQAFPNNYKTFKTMPAPDVRAVANYYDAWRIGKKRLNNLTSLAYSLTNQANEIPFLDSRNAGWSEGIIRSGTQTARITLIQQNTLPIGDSARLELKQFANQLGTKHVMSNIIFQDQDPTQQSKDNQMIFQSTFLYTAQLGAYWNLKNKGNTHLFANGGYTMVRRNDPDTKEIWYKRRFNDTTFPEQVAGAPWTVASSGSTYNVRRVYTRINENTMQGNIEAEHWLLPVWSVKAGAFYEKKDRRVNLRQFTLGGLGNAEQNNLSGGPFGYTTTEDMLDHYMSPDKFRGDETGFVWDEETAVNDSYYADNLNHSYFVVTDVKVPAINLSVFGGARLENNRLRIIGAMQSGQANFPLLVHNERSHFLPSINLNWQPGKTFVARGGYGRTLNRPEFREVAPFQYQDIENYIAYEGNTKLHPVVIDNYDIRFEWYPKSMLKNEMFNFGFFYKKLDAPIEQVLNRENFFESFINTITFVNSGPTKVYGLEAEIRKSLSFIPGALFRNLSFIINGAYIHSEVDFAPQNITGNRLGRKRPLQGQVPYILNAAMNYEDPAKGTKISLSYNITGPMIVLLGNNSHDAVNQVEGIPDVMQRGQNLLDLTWSQRINKHLHLKAGVQNLLDQKRELFVDFNRNYKYDGVTKERRNWEKDRPYQTFSPRPYYSLGLNFIL